MFYQLVRRLEALKETEHNEVFIDGTKLESMANCYTSVWRKTVEKKLAKVKEQAKQLVALWKRWTDYEEKPFVMGNKRNSLSKTDKDATLMRMKEDHMTYNYL